MREGEKCASLLFRSIAQVKVVYTAGESRARDEYKLRRRPNAAFAYYNVISKSKENYNSVYIYSQEVRCQAA